MTNQKQLSVPVSITAIALALAGGLAVGHFAPVLRDSSRGERATTDPTAPEPPKRFMIPVSDSQPSDGPSEALVTIVQWCDLPDPSCAQTEPALKAVRERYSDVLRLVFRHYPKPDLESSALAHQFARAAHEQGGKFWQARALLLSHTGPLTMSNLEHYAGELGLDWANVRAAIDKRTHVSLITGDRLFANMFEVKGSNAIFVNGRPLGQPPTRARLEQLVEQELKVAIGLIARGVSQADVYAELIKKGAWNRVQAPR